MNDATRRAAACQKHMCPSVCLTVCLSFCLPVSLFVCLPVCGAHGSCTALGITVNWGVCSSQRPLKVDNDNDCCLCCEKLCSNCKCCRYSLSDEWDNLSFAADATRRRSRSGLKGAWPAVRLMCVLLIEVDPAAAENNNNAPQWQQRK